MEQAMSSRTPVVLDDELSELVDRQVKSGRFGSAGEVVRAGLRLLADNDARVNALREALIEGEQSGEPEPFDFDEFIRSRHDA
jgi:antitoxin ParD1/3/4